MDLLTYNIAIELLPNNGVYWVGFDGRYLDAGYRPKGKALNPREDLYCLHKGRPSHSGCQGIIDTYGHVISRNYGRISPRLFYKLYRLEGWVGRYND